jgi:hypothetical protein
LGAAASFAASTALAAASFVASVVAVTASLVASFAASPAFAAASWFVGGSVAAFAPAAVLDSLPASERGADGQGSQDESKRERMAFSLSSVVRGRDAGRAGPGDFRAAANL